MPIVLHLANMFPPAFHHCNLAWPELHFAYAVDRICVTFENVLSTASRWQ